MDNFNNEIYLFEGLKWIKDINMRKVFVCVFFEMEWLNVIMVKIKNVFWFWFVVFVDLLKK